MDKRMTPLPPHSVLQKNIARLMVRRHLRSWLGSDIISEDLLIAMFVRLQGLYPDDSMGQIAARTDAEIKELVAIVLNVPPADGYAMADPTDRDSLGLDPG